MPWRAGSPPSGGALWIVAPAPAHAFRNDLKQGGLAAWLWENCQLRNTVGVGRIDFRQPYLQVYRCRRRRLARRAEDGRGPIA